MGTSIRTNLTNDQINAAITSYQETKQLAETSQRYGIDHRLLKQLLLERGIGIHIHRKYDLDKQFFDTIDAEDKAYFLGFLWADGNNNGHGAIILKLSIKDKDILEKLRMAIKSQKPLRHVKNITCTDENGVVYKCRDAMELILSCRELAAKLNSIGLIPNKTATLRLPKEGIVPDHLIHHFIRGYFDGDGTVSKGFQKGRTVPTYQVEMVMKNKKLADEIIEILHSIGIHAINYRASGTVYKICITSGEDRIKFMKWLYRDSTIYLKRKYDRFVELAERYRQYLSEKTSIYRGISLWNGVYVVRKTVNYKTTVLGKFNTEQEAVDCLKKYNNAISKTS